MLSYAEEIPLVTAEAVRYRHPLVLIGIKAVSSADIGADVGKSLRVGL